MGRSGYHIFAIDEVGVFFLIFSLQITNELFRAVIEQKGFYSLDKPGDFITLTVTDTADLLSSVEKEQYWPDATLPWF